VHASRIVGSANTTSPNEYSAMSIGIGMPTWNRRSGRPNRSRITRKDGKLFSNASA
jgi:hypothetical protein